LHPPVIQEINLGTLAGNRKTCQLCQRWRCQLRVTDRACLRVCAIMLVLALLSACARDQEAAQRT
jgi:hypothetical protein